MTNGTHDQDMLHPFDLHYINTLSERAPGRFKASAPSSRQLQLIAATKARVGRRTLYLIHSAAIAGLLGWTPLVQSRCTWR